MRTFDTRREAFQWLIEGLDFVDNYRCAETLNTEQMETYKKAKSEGCCGFMDVEVSIKNANGEYVNHMIGCNYGH